MKPPQVCLYAFLSSILPFPAPLQSQSVLLHRPSDQPCSPSSGLGLGSEPAPRCFPRSLRRGFGAGGAHGTLCSLISPQGRSRAGAVGRCPGPPTARARSPAPPVARPVPRSAACPALAPVPRALTRAIPRATARALSRAGLSRRCACPGLERRRALCLAQVRVPCRVAGSRAGARALSRARVSRRCACPVARPKLALCRVPRRVTGSRGRSRAGSRAPSRATSCSGARALSRAGSRGRSRALWRRGSRAPFCRCRSRPPGGAQLPPPRAEALRGSGHSQSQGPRVVLNEG